MAKENKVQSADQIGNPAILGTFTGKCCDANVFNNNDMHLSREVFETLMASDEYKRAMENRHYIGFAGHPADCDCQDFEHACIVMTDMRLLDNDEIEGDFDLIDTKVGKIIKSFIDAGVKFGISIRGLGDVDANGEVDPAGFIFRGFDLVTFPAYDDCIPEFKAIAASTDIKKKAQYQKICASIDASLASIKSCEALELIQEQLPADSDEYNKVADRIAELTCEPVEEVIIEEAPSEESLAQEEVSMAVDVLEEKLEAVTDLYLDEVNKTKELTAALTEAQCTNQELEIQCKTLKQTKARFNKIVATQLEDSKDALIRYQDRCDHAEDRLKRVTASLRSTREHVTNLRQSLKEEKQAHLDQITANKQLEDRIASLNEASVQRKEEIRASKELNLKYEHKIEANSEAISQKDSQIEDLKAQLSETVVANEELESKASNLDEKNKELLSRVEAAEEMVSSYQQAYANMYANALGVYLTGLTVTASTSVEELTEMIKAGTSTANIAAAPDFYSEEVDEEEADIDDILDNANFSAEMVTL